MLLAVDIGNTNTVAGVFDGDKLCAQWRLATNTARMADEYAALATSLFQVQGLTRTTIDGVILASVVPAARAAVVESTRRYLGLEAIVVSPLLDLGIPVCYDPPTGVGADRIANAVAAVKRYGTPAIVVDFGTGTNFDVVDRDGTYVGGAIAPGIEISFDALVARTSLLPQVALETPTTAVGGSTVSALQSGILFGYAGLVDGLVNRIRKEIGADAHVVATGGLAQVVAPNTQSIQHVDADLTLEGLRLIYERNRHNAGQ